MELRSSCFGQTTNIKKTNKKYYIEFCVIYHSTWSYG